MKYIFSLAFQGTARRKRQSVMMIVVLTISFAFAVMSLSYADSITATNSNYRISEYGSWYAGIIYGEDGDEDFLNSIEGIDSTGITVSYGTVGSTSIGVVDDNFVGFGVSLNQGHLPKASGEIAMEADLLSELGYDYIVGQEITLTISCGSGDDSAYVTKTFTLCGVIKEYSNVWNTTSGTLNGAIICQDDADEILNSVGSSFEPQTSYFFSVKSGYESVVKDEVNSYLRANHTGTSVQVINVNRAVTIGESEAESNSFYMILVFTVAIFAVIIVYILQIQSDIRRIVRMRSLGATKGQLVLLVVAETFLLCIPSMILGTVFGALGTWLLLTISLFSGSATVVVSIPWNAIIVAVLLWILGTLVIRMITIISALVTPLTGRMGMTAKSRRRSTRMQKILIVIMPIVLCYTVIYSLATSMNSVYRYRLYSTYPSYWIHGSTVQFSSERTFVTDDVIDSIADTIGVSNVWGFTWFSSSDANITLSTEEVDDVRVSVYVIDSSADIDLFDLSKVDLEAFENGDCIVLSFPSTDKESVVPDVGESLTVTLFDEDIETTVGGISIYRATDYLGVNYGFDIFDASYSVVCSRAFLQKMIDLIPDGKTLGTQGLYYKPGDTAEFLRAFAFADSNAEYLLTDSVVSEIVNNNDLAMINERETYSTQAQTYLQSLILLFVTSGCIALISAFIIVSLLSLETDREQHKYGILQALGMSKRKRNVRLITNSLLRAIAALAVSWLCYIVYYLAGKADLIKEGSSVFSLLKSHFDSLSTFGLTPQVLCTISLILFITVFLVCYIPKLWLNRYTLMEMLRND